MKILHCCVLTLFMGYVATQADTVVVPNDLANKPGDAGTSTFAKGPVISQQLYMGTEFPSLSSGGGLITEIRFRARGSGDGFPFSIQGRFTDFEARLSTTLRTATTMSIFFAQNIGEDEAIVRPRGSLDWQLVNDGTSSAQSFSFVIPLPTPFYYSPTRGNLLLELVNYKSGAGEGPSTLDFQQTSTKTAAIAGSLGTLSGNGVVPGGFVTEFGVMSVPEPSSFALALFGVILMLNRARKEQQK